MIQVILHTVFDDKTYSHVRGEQMQTDKTGNQDGKQ